MMEDRMKIAHMVAIMVLILALFMVAIVANAAYIDKTPSIKYYHIGNIYQTSGASDVRSGFDFFLQYAEGAWAGLGTTIYVANPSPHYVGIYDSMWVYPNKCPTLPKRWAWYSNANQTTYQDKLYIACYDVFDSIAQADGGVDTLINDDFQWEDMWIHVADDSITMTYGGDTRTIIGVPEMGIDSLNRFPLLAFGWGSYSELEPTGHNFLFQLDNDTVCLIVALGALKNLNNSQAYIPDTVQLEAMGYDNMLIGGSANNCYGVNQASYWQSTVVASYGGSTSDPDWTRIGSALDYNDYCILKQGYFKVVEYSVSYLASLDYGLDINVSNTPKFNLGGYLACNIDSVLGTGGEMRGLELTDNLHTASGFALVLGQVDTSASLGCRLFLEYRINTSYEFDGDIHNPPDYPGGGLTIAWGEWKAETIFGAQLWVQDWETTYFAVTRCRHVGGDNQRWWKIFEYPFGEPAGPRHDSTKSGEWAGFRVYDSGVVIFRPNDYANDTTGHDAVFDVGQSIWWIQADSTEAVDSTFIADGLIIAKPWHSYILKYSEFIEQPPTITAQGPDEVWTDSTVLVTARYQDDYGVSTFLKYVRTPANDSDHIANGILDPISTDTTMAIAYLFDEVGTYKIIDVTSDDSSHEVSCTTLCVATQYSGPEPPGPSDSIIIPIDFTTFFSTNSNGVDTGHCGSNPMRHGYYYGSWRNLYLVDIDSLKAAYAAVSGNIDSAYYTYRATGQYLMNDSTCQNEITTHKILVSWDTLYTTRTLRGSGTSWNVAGMGSGSDYEAASIGNAYYIYDAGYDACTETILEYDNLPCQINIHVGTGHIDSIYNDNDPYGVVAVPVNIVGSNSFRINMAGAGNATPPTLVLWVPSGEEPPEPPPAIMMVRKKKTGE